MVHSPPRRLSDGSTESMKSSKTKKTDESCRHIETLFARDVVPKSVHGDNFFLPAQIIRNGCDKDLARDLKRN